jgi:hypothetical protein
MNNLQFSTSANVLQISIFDIGLFNDTENVKNLYSAINHFFIRPSHKEMGKPKIELARKYRKLFSHRSDYVVTDTEFERIINKLKEKWEDI